MRLLKLVESFGGDDFVWLLGRLRYWGVFVKLRELGWSGIWSGDGFVRVLFLVGCCLGVFFFLLWRFSLVLYLRFLKRVLVGLEERLIYNMVMMFGYRDKMIDVWVGLLIWLSLCCYMLSELDEYGIGFNRGYGRLVFFFLIRLVMV